MHNGDVARANVAVDDLGGAALLAPRARRSEGTGDVEHEAYGESNAGMHAEPPQSLHLELACPLAAHLIAIADLLQSVVNENSVNRDKLRQFLQELAVQKEQEFQVADQEAQRCRSVMMKQSTGSAAPGKHK